MLNDEILDSEQLYRAVPNHPNMWKSSENRPTSAIFKDSKGVSVDRDGERKETQIVSTFQSRFPNLKAIVRISASDCRKNNTHPIADILPDNPFHALILDSANEITISASKAKKLQKVSVVIFEK